MNLPQPDGLRFAQRPGTDKNQRNTSLSPVALRGRSEVYLAERTRFEPPCGRDVRVPRVGVVWTSVGSAGKAGGSRCHFAASFQPWCPRGGRGSNRRAILRLLTDSKQIHSMTLDTESLLLYR